MGDTYILREARAEDCHAIHQLLTELTTYEKKPDAYKNNVESKYKQ